MSNIRYLLILIANISLYSQTELIVNGDFEQGNAYFVSEYKYSTSDLWTEGYYSILTNPNQMHHNFSNCKDHTSQSGYMLVINGSIIPNKALWSQLITNIRYNSFYKFSAWFCSVVPASPARIRVTINNVDIAPEAFFLPGVSCQWVNISYKWPSDTDTALIKIYDDNLIGGGNDFAVDDISLINICTIQAEAGKEKIICPGDSTTIGCDPIGGVAPFEYSWEPILGLNDSHTKNPIVRINKSARYKLTVIDSLGCVSTDSVDVIVLPKPEIQIYSESHKFLCDGDSITLFVSPKNHKFKYLWSTGDTTSAIRATQSGIYSVIVENEYGCSSDMAFFPVEFNFNQLAYSVNSDNSFLFFDTTYLRELSCKPLMIYNMGEQEKIIDRIYIFRNVEFSIPPSQLPLKLKANDSSEILVCYNPSGIDFQKDTLILADICTDHIIPLLGIGEGYVYDVESKCGKRMVIRAISVNTYKYYCFPFSPNPFSELTIINYQLTIPERVRLDVFNSLGEKITTLVDEFQDAGKHSATFEAGGLPQGVYYYKIQIGERFESGKLVLIR